jgi:hypothetical protein
MRRFIRVLTVALALVVGAPSAFANHGNVDYYQEESSPWLADTWLGGVQRDFCTDGLTLGAGQFSLTQTEINNTEASIVQGVTRWEADTDITTNWVWTGACPSTTSFLLRREDNFANFCENLHAEFPNIQSRVDYDDTELPGDYGETLVCDMDNNGRNDFFWVVIDEDRDWHHYWNSPVPTGKYDLAGLFSHEFGHATGFDGHFPSGSGACPITQNYSTMCTGNVIGFHNGSDGDGTGWRSLGQHDTGAANLNY